ncbi:methyl-accepting chemotaxis protein [Roseomonas fluvialis]|uniref:Chemotaxis protein n=1 Tax=Roseomonas fluvialis TaxID=1750527 RepID=A0ABN6P7X1_9PROT|nr:methyl-accepting chemotaxis protein [Roseomonas fluvialis]BDG74836.1 chemotaxis protein [Roseomonas fluvialis]
MDLELLRRGTGRFLLVLLWVLALLTPVAALIAGRSPEDAAIGAAMVGVMALVASVAARAGAGAPGARHAIAVGLMVSVSVQVWLAPPALAIDLHMAYFASLALLSGFVDWRSILLGATVVALHHLVLNFAAPAWVFGVPEGSLGRVVLHAAVLVVESSALILMTRRLEAAALRTDAALNEARAARAAEAAEAAQRLAQEEAARGAAQQAREGVAVTVEQQIGRIAIDVETASVTLGAAAQRISTAAGEGAAGAQSARAAVAEASGGVQAVAAGAEQLAASVSEISRQVAAAASVARTAAERADATGGIVRGLSEGAQRIGDVVRLIGEIAGQTNLLALNATIEAARAGESGKGFAVVASEVKALAGQTARATEEIGAQVAAIQHETQGAVDAIQGIAEVVQQVNEVAAAIAAAVEQQGAATREIAGSTAGVARGTELASDAVDTAAERMARTRAEVAELERMSERLRREAAALRAALGSTLAGLRAA